ncbi:LOW QUALITY PROTEIN: U3 small nucleolar RNA-associated protein 14 homolog A-like, partial [Ceratina calcarata]|uniref:LOW QUALITY PROTEIN: U3 small nucleolar RNA-associated protein 14 homolog A-like n=1 Tax=Ceratina calcarata TaxID=156304 RepID=A0AAJ7N3E5_9HYME
SPYRVKKVERSEPTLEVSEFHLVKSGISDQDTVHVQEIARILRKKGHHIEIARNIETAKKNIRVLPKPLEKPAAERIKRIVGFEGTKKELKKWNAVIMKNRVADSLQFPLNHSSLKLESSNEFVKKFRIQSDLEKELAALEPQKENIEEKDDEFSLTLKEIAIKRKEAAKIRAQQSYKEAKARRQNKIKSKKFHRVQKKEKIKQQLKEFEQLQKTDPEAALEKLEQLDRTRAEERMSLRHKNTGKWAKSKQIRAKYDKETRQELAQQLSVSRELTQKLKKPDDSEEGEEDDNIPIQSLTNDKENPWVGNVKTESEINEFIQSYRKYWEGQNKHTQDKEINDITKITTENILTDSSKNEKIRNAPIKKNSNINIDSSEIKVNDEKANNDKNSTVSDLKSHFILKGE